MRTSDLISVRDTTRTVDLTSTELLLESLQREGADLTLSTASQLRELLAEYVTAETEPIDVLRVILSVLGSGDQRGGAFFVRGPSGAGKSHLLALLALLLQYPPAWSIFLDAHPSYSDLRSRVADKPRVVVPIPLADHRGQEEHLEDVIFDRTERVLRAPPYGVSVPLSEQTHALDLIERHVVPRYREELDERTRQWVPGSGSWEQLRQLAPDQAVQVARRFVHEIGYPLDFRQSRVERLSRLLEIMREQGLTNIVWLLDDLHEFLSSVGPKALHSDCSFLDFIGQRCKVAPLFMIATLEEGLEHLTSIEPYLLSALRSSFRTDLQLSGEHMRTVARSRVISRTDPARYDAAIAEIRQAYQRAFGAVSFSEGDLAESYPLHPTALKCLEGIASRLFGAADTLLGLLQDLLNPTTPSSVLHRDFRQLITCEDVFDYLRPRIAAHPEVSSYIHDALDYYQKNAAEVFPEAPELCPRIMRALIVFRLGNVAAPVSLLAESLGINPDGQPTAEPALVERALEAMRLGGSFVDVRRGLGGSAPVYVVDVHTGTTESLRRRIAATKASLSSEDPRLWSHVYSACDDPSLPLARLAEPRTLEVQWENTFRCVCTQLLCLSELTSSTLAEYVAELGDPATVEDAHLFIATLAGPGAQAEVWHQLCESLPSNRWSAALVAWVPRDLTPQELDTLKEFAAVRELLGDPALASAEAALRDRLTESHAPLLSQVRRIVRSAYYDGRVIPPFGHPMGPAELGPLAGNWTITLQAITERVFARVFPDFPGIAPRRPLVAREQIDTLTDQVIRPGSVLLAPDDPLRDAVEAFLVPLGIAVVREHECVIEVGRSKVVSEVMATIGRRDQTPRHEPGRPLACSDLAQQLVKSPLGLPPELFELVVAALIRTGYLAPMRDRHQLVRLEDCSTPLSASVQYVARPPLLAPAEWQLLARICRILLDFPLSGPDLATQTRAWERLVQARAEFLDRAEDLRRKLDMHIRDLDHHPAQWAETFESLQAAERAFQCIRPELHPALGLQEFLNDVQEYLTDIQGTPRLARLVRTMDTLAAYLDTVAPDVVAVRRYLLSPELNLTPGSDLEARRQHILGLIAAGEQLLTDEMNLRRQVQIFTAAYHRQYATWHARVYRSPLFDQYRSIYQSPEMRALSQLSKLNLRVDTTAAEIAARVEAQTGRRCTRTDLSEALHSSPVCPTCRLRLGEEPELLPIEALLEEIHQAIRGYIRALATPPIPHRLSDYAAGMSRRSDVAARIEAILQLGPDPTPREILTLFTDEVITHLNRALAGKRVTPRNFAELRDALEGRTIPKEEAQRLFLAWLKGNDEDIDDNDLVQIDS